MFAFLLASVIFVLILGYLCYLTGAATVSIVQMNYDRAYKDSLAASIISAIAAVLFILIILACLYLKFGTPAGLVI